MTWPIVSKEIGNDLPELYQKINAPQFRELSCNLIRPAYSSGRRVLRITKRPEPVNLVHRLSCDRHEPFCYSCRYLPTPKTPRGATPGVRSDPKHRQLARQVGGVSTIQASSMAVTFHSKIAVRPGSIFCFGTISSIADEEGILHRLADLPEQKSEREMCLRAISKYFGD